DTPSQDFIYSVESLAYEIYKKYGDQIENFRGGLKQFSGIKELIEKHLNVSLIYPQKGKVPDNVRLNFTEREMVEQAKKFIKDRDDSDMDYKDDDFTDFYVYKPPSPPDDGDDRFPYPYVYKPPEPPDDIEPAFQAQRIPIKEKEETQAELDCPYCGYKLPKGQKNCPICGKDVF
ncbi:MAG: hypothetical protein WBH31_02725, partial [Promethearchaeia archaeon]